MTLFICLKTQKETHAERGKETSKYWFSIQMPTRARLSRETEVRSSSTWVSHLGTVTWGIELPSAAFYRVGQQAAGAEHTGNWIEAVQGEWMKTLNPTRRQPMPYHPLPRKMYIKIQSSKKSKIVFNHIITLNKNNVIWFESNAWNTVIEKTNLHKICTVTEILNGLMEEKR